MCRVLRRDGSTPSFQSSSILTTPDCKTQHRSNPESQSPFWGSGANLCSHPRRERNRVSTSSNTVHPQAVPAKPRMPHNRYVLAAKKAGNRNIG